MIEDIMKSVEDAGKLKTPEMKASEKSTATASVGQIGVSAPVTPPGSEIPSWAQELIAQNKEMKAELTMFKDMAGKNEIASYLNAKKDFTKKTVHFKLWNGKPVIAWSSLDYKSFNPRAMDALGENIKSTLTLLDGTQEEVNYIQFIRVNDLVKVPFTSINGKLIEVEWTPELVALCGLKSDKMMLESKFVNV